MPSFDFEASSHGSPVRAPLRPLHVDGQVCAGLKDSAATIVDAHNDLLLATVVLRKEQSLGLVLRRGRERLFERYWLPRLEAGAVGVQVCPLYAASWPVHEALAAGERVDDHVRPIEELARLYTLHDLLLGRTPDSEWLPIDDELRAELRHRLLKAGFDGELREALDCWAGVENLENRVAGAERIDPVVLRHLRFVT